MDESKWRMRVKNKLMVSSDVTSLFTNIPVETIIEHILKNHQKVFLSPQTVKTILGMTCLTNLFLN